MPSTYILIASNVLASASASITFSSIPQTYTDLVLSISGRSDSGGGTADTVVLRFNSDSTSKYSDTYIQCNGAAVSSSTNGANQTDLQSSNVISGSISTANTFGNVEFYISQYATTGTKLIRNFGTSENNATTAYTTVTAQQYRGTSGISSISITNPTYAAGSSFRLYGIKNS